MVMVMMMMMMTMTMTMMMMMTTMTMTMMTTTMGMMVIVMIQLIDLFKISILKIFIYSNLNPQLDQRARGARPWWWRCWQGSWS